MRPYSTRASQPTVAASPLGGYEKGKKVKTGDEAELQEV